MPGNTTGTVMMRACVLLPSPQVLVHGEVSTHGPTSQSTGHRDNRQKKENVESVANRKYFSLFLSSVLCVAEKRCTRVQYLDRAARCMTELQTRRDMVCRQTLAALSQWPYESEYRYRTPWSNRSTWCSESRSLLAHFALRVRAAARGDGCGIPEFETRKKKVIISPKRGEQQQIASRIRK